MDRFLTVASKNAFVDTKTSVYPNHPVTKVYDRHIDTVYRVCLSLLGRKQDAEDVVQTVFLTLLERDVTFNDEEHEKAWLINRNKQMSGSPSKMVEAQSRPL